MATDRARVIVYLEPAELEEVQRIASLRGWSVSKQIRCWILAGVRRTRCEPEIAVVPGAAGEDPNARGCWGCTHLVKEGGWWCGIGPELRPLLPGVADRDFACWEAPDPQE